MYRSGFRSPLLVFGLIGLLCTLLLAWYLWRVGISYKGSFLIPYLVSLNLVTIVFYAYDKMIAGKSFTRVPENVLHLLALAGGSPAALGAQKMLRHKTVKQSFQTMYWVIVVVQIALVVWYLFV